MPLSNKQSALLRGMSIGGLIAVSIVLLGGYFNPLQYSDALNLLERLNVAISWSLIPTVFLAIAIGRLAKHRFFTPEDIDAGAHSEVTARARVLQSLLQNTLEQTSLAVLVYCIWSVVMPANFLSVIPFASVLFGLGRVIFFMTYERGASARSVGFTLSFYPSVIMLLGVIASLFL